MTIPFFVFLEKKHTIPKATPVFNAETQSLQTLLDAGDTVGFDKLRAKLLEGGRKFQITDMKVYEPEYRGDMFDIQIALQVKGCSITNGIRLSICDLNSIAAFPFINWFSRLSR